MHRIVLTFLLAAASLSAPRASAGAAPGAPAIDSVEVSPPAPLIVPGKPAVGEPTKSREARAAEYAALGRQLEQQGALTSAVAAYRNAVLFDTTLTGVAYRAGRILATLGDDATAANMFAIEVARQPGDDDAARELGLALSRSGRHELALRQLHMLVRRAPNADSAWSALGMAQLAAGDAAAAESSFRSARAIAPLRASESRDLAVALAALGRTTEARFTYRLAIRMDPRDATTWLNLGNLERDDGDREAALAAYREAERRDSTLAPAILGQARALKALGRTRDAGDAYRRWVAAAPLDLGARLESVQHFLAEGRADIALEIARDAVRRDNRSPDAHLLMGVALDANGRKRESLESLRRSEALFQSDVGRKRARTLIEKLRASAPDSLRGLFRDDSLRAAARAAAPGGAR